MDTVLPCALCGYSNSRSLYTVSAAEPHATCSRFTVVQCGDCGLVALSPQLDAEAIRQFYLEEYYAKDRLRLKSLLEDDIPGLRRADRVERYLQGGTILDIGCGSGKFLGSLDAGRWRKMGLEVSPIPAAYAHQQFGIEICLGELLDAHFPDSAFDAVTMWHVFEHIPNPLEVLHEVGRILKKGGLLVIAVPNFNSVERKLTKDKWYHLDVPRHYFHYTPETLRKMLELLDFHILETKHLLLKNWYGFLQSILNCLGFRKELLRNYLDGRLKAEEKNILCKAQLFIALASLPCLSLVTFLATLAESLMRMGGTIEVYARKN